MEEKNIKICCKYGFSVNLLIDNIELFIEDIEAGQEINEKDIKNIKNRIENIRKHEEDFKSMLEIE